MSLRINQNVEAIAVHHNLVATGAELARSLQRLSSGLRINSAADDAAGLAMSEKMRAQVSGLNQAGRNAQDGISLVQTAEGGLGGVHSILQRLRQLAVEAANDTLTTADRTTLQTEITLLISEVDRISTSTDFNTKPLLNGSLAVSGVSLQVGANAGQVIAFTVGTMNASALTISGLSVSTHAAASQAIVSLDNAINTISTQRSTLGAVQNRLERVINQLTIASEAQAQAESRIRDLDIAEETINLVRHQILQQAGVAALAQANASPQAVLSLLQVQ